MSFRAPATKLPRTNVVRNARPRLRRVRSREIANCQDAGGRTIENTEWIECTFLHVAISGGAPLTSPTTVRNCVLARCVLRGGSFYFPIFDGIRVETLQWSFRQSLRFQDALFRHVTLLGRMPFFIIDRYSDYPRVAKERGTAVDAARVRCREWYDACDWALDVREAEFLASPDIYDIPARCLRLRPDTQVVLSAKKLKSRRDWEKHAWSGTDLKYRLEQADHRGLDEVVIIAAERSKKFGGQMLEIELLRKWGVLVDGGSNA